MTHRTRLTCAILFLVGVVFFTIISLPSEHDRKTKIHPETTAPLASEPDQTIPDFFSKAKTKTPPPHIVNFAANEKINRGKNQQLIFTLPHDHERKVRAGQKFAHSPFIHLQKKALGPLSVNEHTISAIDVKYDPAVIQQFLTSDAEIFRLPLSSEKSADVRVQRVISRDRGTYSFLGKVTDDPLSDVLLVFHDGTVSGSITYYKTNTHYEFGASGDGDITIRHLNPQSYNAPCACPTEHNHPADEADEIAGVEKVDFTVPIEPSSQDILALQNEEILPANEVAVTYIDTVVGYGMEARAAQGGVAAMEARIIASVDRTNLAFENSLIQDTQLVLAATVEDPDYDYPGAVSGSMGTSTAPDELQFLNKESDGQLDTVTDLKLALGADHCAFIIKSPDGSAGIASRPGKAMIVALTYMTSTRITFAHELGHNIGCQHAWADGSSSLSTSYNNYGWRINSPNAGKVRSVMSYDWGWTRIPYFSNPNVQYGGANTGAPDGYDATGDSTADPRVLSGGYSGQGGAGYDGSNSNLGANNAAYIQGAAASLADKADRPASGIKVEQPAGSTLVDNESSVNFIVSSYGDQITKTFTITNTWQNSLENIALSVSGDTQTSFNLGALSSTSLAMNESMTFAVTYTANTPEKVTAVLQITSNAENTPAFDIDLSGEIRIVLNDASFASDFGVWQNTNTGLSWTRNQGSTASSSTGSTGAPDGSYYIYTEASNNYGKTADLEATFDFTGQSNITLEFSYHMYGNDMGNFSIDVYDGVWNLDLIKLSEQQQTSDVDTWKKTVVDLSPYANKSAVTIRLRGLVGSGYRSDISIDNVLIYTVPPSYTLSYTAGTGGGVSGITNQEVMAGANGSPVLATAADGYTFSSWSDSSIENPRTDTAVTANLSLQAIFTQNPIDGFTAWVTSYALTGADANILAAPKGDGISNLIKYAFNINPSIFDNSSMLPYSGTSGLPHVSRQATGGGRLTIEYLRRKSATDLNFTVQFSSSLTSLPVEGNWTESVNEVSVTNIDADWERVIVEDAAIYDGDPNRFVRVKIDLLDN